MRDQRTAIVLAIGCSIVGIEAAIFGTITSHAAAYRAGALVTVVSLGVAILLTSRRNTQRLMDHQARLARLTAQERQHYAELGWRAAQLDAANGEIPRDDGIAEVVTLPHARISPGMRRNGSA